MKYTVEGLDCANCAARIESALRGQEGLESASVNFSLKSLDIPPDMEAKAREIIGKMEPGVSLVRPHDHTHDDDGAKEGGRAELLRLIVAGLLLVLGFSFNEPLHQTPFSWAEYAVLLPSYLLVGWEVIIRAVRNIVRGQAFEENFLMTVATVGAIAIHQLPEAAAVMVFYAAGEYLQDLAVGRSRRSISALLDIRPDYANLLENGGTRRVRPEEVTVGQLIVVKPGEKVPLDGEITDGLSFVDTAALTGESVPRKVGAGDAVLAAMINGQGLLSVRVTKLFEESSVARILELVENAAARKAPTEQFITKFARYYTPAVVVVAALVAVIPPLVIPGATFSQWVYRALVLLVISCPCALVISVPLGYFGGIGSASRHGILIKGANYLEALADLDTVVFDKTGTLTRGVFRVTEVVPADGFDQEKVLATAAAVELFSNHPIAHSIREAYGKAISPDQVTDYREVPGFGVSAVINGRKVMAGNDRLLHREGVVHQDGEVGGTVVHLVIDGEYAGHITISDEIKDDARQAISALKAMGVRRTVMLTGDGESVARLVAEKVGIDSFYAGLLPEGKVEKVEELEAALPNRRTHKLAFVGDGVNDAPVLTRSDVGVAMGGLGSDAAIEAADVVLMEDAPSKLALGVRIARRTRSIVKQNVFAALTVKAIFLLLGTVGVATIWEAVFADVGVALLAVLNAARTLSLRQKAS